MAVGAPSRRFPSPRPGAMINSDNGIGFGGPSPRSTEINRWRDAIHDTISSS